MQSIFYKVEDEIQFNSDPDEEDIESHMHQGKVVKINNTKNQITIKRSDDHQEYTYFIDEIEVNDLHNVSKDEIGNDEYKNDHDDRKLTQIALTNYKWHIGDLIEYKYKIKYDENISNEWFEGKGIIKEILENNNGKQIKIKLDYGVIQFELNKIEISKITTIDIAYICVCGKRLQKVNDAKTLYDGDGVYCDECDQEGQKNQIIWHCNEEFSEMHGAGYDICNQCVDKYKLCELEQCECFDRLYFVMIKYKELMLANNNYTDIENMDLLSILNDYLHVLFEHDEDRQFDQIAKKLGCCDINSCNIFQRNYRNRRDLRDDTNRRSALYSIHGMTVNRALLQILDKIHCLYYHSYDMGNKLPMNDMESINQQNDDEKKDDNNIDNVLFDTEIVKKYEIILNKRKIMHFNKLDLNRKIKYNQLDKPIIKDYMYSIGHLFIYDDKDKINTFVYGMIDVQAIHGSLKDELLTNMLATISMEQFKYEYKRAQIHYLSHHCKKTFDCDELTIQHLLSIMIYCNYDHLQYEFSKTYRENIEYHSQFYHLGRLLKRTVNEFGTTIKQGNISKFYHGIGEKLIFPEMCGGDAGGLYLYCPLSTSSAVEVALNFTNHNNGLIAEFGGLHVPQCQSKYFSCAWLSDYANEKEYLFLQNIHQLNINNVTFPKSGMEFVAIIQALEIMDKILRGDLNDDKSISDKMANLIIAIIENQLSYSLSQYQQFSSLVQYAQSMINSFCNNRPMVEINYLAFMAERSFLSQYFVYSGFGWIRTDLINLLFPNITSLNVYKVNLSSMTINNVLWDLSHTNSKSKLTQIMVYPDENSDISVIEAINQYASMFRANDMFIYTQYNQRTMLNAVAESIYDFVLNVLWHFGKLYVNDTNEVIANSLKILVDQRVSKSVTNKMNRYSTLFDKECMDNLDLDIDWECITNNDNKYCSYLYDLFCYSEFDWIKLDTLELLFPNIEDLSIRNINLCSSALDNLLLYLGNKAETMTTIRIMANNDSDLDCDTAILRYESRFEKLQFTMEKEGNLEWISFCNGYKMKTVTYKM